MWWLRWANSWRRSVMVNPRHAAVWAIRPSRGRLVGMNRRWATRPTSSGSEFSTIRVPSPHLHRLGRSRFRVPRRGNRGQGRRPLRGSRRGRSGGADGAEEAAHMRSPPFHRDWVGGSSGWRASLQLSSGPSEDGRGVSDFVTHSRVSLRDYASVSVLGWVQIHGPVGG